MSNKDKYPCIVRFSRNHGMFLRPMRIISMSLSTTDLIITEIDKPLDDNQKPIIVCDGCSNIIDTEYINCLSFEEESVHSCQCSGCVKKYFSDLPIINL